MSNNQNEDSKKISNRQISTLELILLVKKNKWWVLFACAIAFAITFYQLNRKYLTYSSASSFVVSDSPLPSSGNADAGTSNAFSHNESFNRMQQLILSNEMIDHLIGKFDLYVHYRIDRKKEFFYSRIFQTVLGNMGIKRTPFGLISVTYKDRDRYLAADIANDIVSELDFLNKKFIVTSFRQKQGISDSVLMDMMKENSMAATHFDTLLTNFNSKINSMDRVLVQNTQAFEMQRSLMQLTLDLKSSTDDLTKLRKMYRWSAEALEGKNLPSVTPIQKALPDTHSIIVLAFSFAALAALCMFFIAILVVYFLSRYASYLREIFSWK